MFDQFEKLSVKERQEMFLNTWASGAGLEFINDEAKAAYQYRTGLIKDAIQLKKTPDRIPVLPIAEWAVPRLAGITAKQAMYEPELARQAYADY